ncbi:MAG: hypothetical protein M3433_08530 [Actinomycetota bacterium]|nr:hypothetical protein [Actinomycetota bacterium]
MIERLFQATLGAWDILTVYLGDRLGLYRALAEAGSLTSGELAAATGTHERYVREWLEQQAANGVLDGFSVLHCLPVGIVGEGAAGTGTVMRAETARRYAEEAGFRAFEVLPIENDFYRFYRFAPG